eukprot:gene5215-18443_t
MSLWTLVQAALMIGNGVAVLNNDRFLERNGFGFSQMGSGQLTLSTDAKDTMFAVDADPPGVDQEKAGG